MSYTEIVKKYEPQVGKKFSYDDAIKYWTALDEPNKIHKESHLICNQHNNDEHNASCITRSKILDTVIEHKKKAIHFYNKTINNSALFSSKDKDNFLKNIKNTKLYTDLKEKMVGGYYEKYMKYKAKYLSLKRDILAQRG